MICCQLITIMAASAMQCWLLSLYYSLSHRYKDMCCYTLVIIDFHLC